MGHMDKSGRCLIPYRNHMLGNELLSTAITRKHTKRYTNSKQQRKTLKSRLRSNQLAAKNVSKGKDVIDFGVIARAATCINLIIFCTNPNPGISSVAVLFVVSNDSNSHVMAAWGFDVKSLLKIISAHLYLSSYSACKLPCCSCLEDMNLVPNLTMRLFPWLVLCTFRF